MPRTGVQLWPVLRAQSLRVVVRFSLLLLWISGFSVVRRVWGVVHGSVCSTVFRSSVFSSSSGGECLGLCRDSAQGWLSSVFRSSPSGLKVVLGVPLPYAPEDGAGGAAAACKCFCLLCLCACEEVPKYSAGAFECNPAE
ncbi:hypothetical protein T08_4988 [Trichinella sp. T8]|nr:hypothetical protein T08_4988 [Trichinella sp. T8]